MISISCLESKLLNNNNWYGRFQLAPFQKGEGLTVANALRRTLLAEKSNFFITWVDFYNAEIPYSVLTGMRESIFDILLNLKQVIFTSDTILPNNSHFFKMPENNNFSTQNTSLGGVKFFSCSSWNEKKWENGLNLTANGTTIFAKQTNQHGVLDANLNTLTLPTDGRGPVLSPLEQKRPAARPLKIKKPVKSTQTIYNKISKDFNSSILSIHRPKNTLRPWLNQSINMLLPISKNNRTNKALEFGTDKAALNFKNQTINFQTQNVFCQNQILGKTMNTENETSYLVPLRIFNKDIDSTSQFDTYNSKKMFRLDQADSTYIGYICAKGPATIYAKNIKLPKGLKCVDPDKYIATLADDGLFYLRFALTTDIKPLALKNTFYRDGADLSITINQTIKFNTVKSVPARRGKSHAKILFNKEINSNFKFSNNPDRLKQRDFLRTKKKLKNLDQYCLSNNQIHLFGSEHITPPILSNFSQKKSARLFTHQLKPQVNPHRGVTHLALEVASRAYWPNQKSLPVSFKFDRTINKRKAAFASYIKLYNYKMWPVNCTKNLISSQRLVLTNDSIKQLNFQNTGVTANIQKTCLLNIQIKHYYYKCGRFDRFLFDLIKPFKPTIKSTRYNQPYFRNQRGSVHAENIFSQFGLVDTNNDWHLFYLICIFERQRSNSQIFMDCYENNLKRPVLKNLLKKKGSASMGRMDKISDSFSSDTPNVNLSSTIQSDHLDRSIFSFMHAGDQKIFKNDLLIQSQPLKNPARAYFSSSWPKIFKSIKTSSIYDYIAKVHTNDATLICYLLTKANSLKQVKEKFGSNYLGVFKLYKPYRYLRSTAEKFVNRCVSFQCSKNHIFGVLQAYVLQYTNSSSYHMPQKHLLGNLLFQSSFFDANKLITGCATLRIKFLRQWSSLVTKHNRKTKLIKQPYISEPKYQFLNSVRKSTNLRLKPFIFIRQISYKNIWIFPYKFQQNKDKLWSKWFFGSQSFQTNSIVSKAGGQYREEQLGKNQTQHLSYLPIETRKNMFRLHRANSITNNSVVLKPVYLNIEQIIYILKQTTRFHKNQRINSVFFDFINGLQSDDLYPLNDSVSFPHVGSRAKIHRVADYLNSSFYKPRQDRLNNLLPVTTHSHFIDSNRWISKTNHMHGSALYHVWILGTNFVFKKFRQDGADSYTTSFKSQNYWSWKSIYNFNTTSQLPLGINYELELDFLHKKNARRLTRRYFFPNILSAHMEPHRFMHYNIFTQQYSVFHDSFYFWFTKQNQKKQLLSHIFTKNTVFDQKEMIKQFFFSAAPCASSFSKYSILKKNNRPFKHLLFSKNANQRNQFSTSMWPIKQLENREVSNFLARYELRQPELNNQNKNGKAIPSNSNDWLSMLRVNYSAAPPASNIDNLYSEPYNINIYHSKISFSLRYTYPFKYTIFETFLPFVNSSENIFRWNGANKRFRAKKKQDGRLDNLIQNYDIFSPSNAVLFKNENALGLEKEINKHHQVINNYRESNKIPTEEDSKMIGYQYGRNRANFDFIQYHESFKIYTALAYTCLNTYEPHLPKYQNLVFSGVCGTAHNKPNKKKSQVLSYDPQYSKTSKYFESTLSAPPIKLWKHVSLKSLIENWAPFSKNNKNSVVLHVPNFLAKSGKHSAYPSFMIPHQLPTRFNNAYKWRIMNNSNFNDAFITIPCTWSLNLQCDRLFNLKDLFSSFYKFYYVDSIFQNTHEMIFLESILSGGFGAALKNKLDWSKITNTKNSLNSIGLDGYQKSYTKKNTKAINREFQINHKNRDGETISNSAGLEPRQKYHLIEKFMTKRSVPTIVLKKLAITFENIYYKNFLWNSRKITLRVLNNAILPLLANRKYSTCDFTGACGAALKKKTRAPMDMPIKTSYSPKFSASVLAGPKLWGLKQKMRTNSGLNSWHGLARVDTKTNTGNHQIFVSQKKNQLTNHWFYQLSPGRATGMFSRINNYQKTSFYSVRYKNLGTTNFMCLKTDPSSLNTNHIKPLQPNFSENFSHASTRMDKMEISNVRSNKNNESELLSSIGSQFLMDDPLSPEKLVSQRKNQWMSKLMKGSKSFNLKDDSKNDSKIISPLINNLWLSTFFCRYSLYTISIKSDLFLQNLISVSNLNSSSSLGLARNYRTNLTHSTQATPVVSLQPKRWGGTQDDSIGIESGPKNRNTNNDSETGISKTDLRVYSKNLKEIRESIQTQATPVVSLQPKRWGGTQEERSQVDQFLNVDSSLKSYNKTIQKVLKSQCGSVRVDNKSVNFFSRRVKTHVNSNYHWQKTVHFAILGRFQGLKFNDRRMGSRARKKIRFNPYINQSNYPFLQYPKKNSAGTWINLLKNKYSIRRLKNFSRYFGNPLSRRINQDNGLNFYNMTLPTELSKQFTTNKFKKANQHIIKSWKSTIFTMEAPKYFCFRYPLFIQNCNLPWQKSKQLFSIAPHWLNRISEDFKPLVKLIYSTYLSKTQNINTALNTGLFRTYTPLSSSSNQTHQCLLPSRSSKNMTSLSYLHPQDKGSYGIINYFTIKESVNSIYKVNYIVESQASEVKSLSEFAFHYNKNDQINRPRTFMEGSLKRFEDMKNDFVTTDSLTISNFLNGTYSFIPNKKTILRSFNELIDLAHAEPSKINQSKIENENEYIQIDIWTNGEISPRQALLNAFRKLFELFYNLSKYNCLKPIEI